ncbi:GNAT family N-acetyltransferase [Schaalia naturae]|uniref:GNAT family N-acetyltransferase n=1 Tax=Schaalia naturae TaxID=635203 RepID=A0ABW2SM67_9ACTO
MPDIVFRPLGAAEFPHWRGRCLAGLAEELIAAGEASAPSAPEHARRILHDLMPRKLDTPGHRVLVAQEGSRQVGAIWLAVRGDPPRVHVLDLHVEEDLRSRGYGRAIMELTEQWARDHGAAAISLDVFSTNTVARGLYLSMGYTTTNERMTKPLT